jgi:hypothetical protein
MLALATHEPYSQYFGKMRLRRTKVPGAEFVGKTVTMSLNWRSKDLFHRRNSFSSCRHSARVSRIQVECGQYPFVFRIGYCSYSLLETTSCRICHHLRFSKERLTLSSGSSRWTGWISDEPWSTCSSRAQIILEGLARRDEIFRKRRESEHPQRVLLMT